ncbi:hypothetical protein Q8F55_007911 [Vanrija albida]|uniref:Mid2 domain-containing protein n=1 Tax=Vanrija albida TaxID=181172 RepID=A0ABR3PV05_9TREE
MASTPASSTEKASFTSSWATETRTVEESGRLASTYTFYYTTKVPLPRETEAWTWTAASTVIPSPPPGAILDSDVAAAIDRADRLYKAMNIVLGVSLGTAALFVIFWFGLRRKVNNEMRGIKTVWDSVDDTYQDFQLRRIIPGEERPLAKDDGDGYDYPPRPGSGVALAGAAAAGVYAASHVPGARGAPAPTAAATPGAPAARAIATVTLLTTSYVDGSTSTWWDRYATLEVVTTTRVPDTTVVSLTTARPHWNDWNGEYMASARSREAQAIVGIVLGIVLPWTCVGLLYFVSRAACYADAQFTLRKIRRWRKTGPHYYDHAVYPGTPIGQKRTAEAKVETYR